jgi:uncharacterized membrane protein HdeD (DUF308 family)
VLALYVALRSGGKQIWAPLLEGVVGIAAGLITFFVPGLTALALLFVIAAWAILTGIVEAIGAIRMRQVIENEWTLIFSGVLSVLFGVLLIAQPGAGVLALVWLIGIYAVLFGVAMLALAWKLRGLLDHTHEVSSSARQTKAA